jgi:hypothetical protein
MEMGKPPTRRLRIFLRDFRMVEATVHLADGQALASYFANRKSYVNLRGAHWTGAGDTSSTSCWSRPGAVGRGPDGDIPLTSASLAVPTLRRDAARRRPAVPGRLALSEQQRLSDYLETPASSCRC